MSDKLLHLHVVIIDIDENNISTVKITFRFLGNRKHILASIKPVAKAITVLDLLLKFLNCQQILLKIELFRNNILFPFKAFCRYA